MLGKHRAKTVMSQLYHFVSITVRYMHMFFYQNLIYEALIG